MSEYPRPWKVKFFPSGFPEAEVLDANGDTVAGCSQAVAIEIVEIVNWDHRHPKTPRLHGGENR